MILYQDSFFKVTPISKEEIEKYDWKIIIPKIELTAPIEEGVSLKVIAKTVGHFPSTSLIQGNVGLAGHNLRTGRFF